MPAPRTLLFTVCLYASLIIVMAVGSPTLLMPRPVLMGLVRWWSRYFVWICRVVGGIGMEVRGREKIPPGPLLVAAKHQSLWETFALIGLFDDPCFILKRELTWIPLFGWYAQRARMLPVNRTGGGSVLADLNQRARKELRNGKGRQLIFFPEGTRRAAGAAPAYRHGVSFVYQSIDVPPAQPEPAPRHDPGRDPRPDPGGPAARRVLPARPRGDRDRVRQAAARRL
jgi:1-acyl-sn-glycerol-3-phosphate acyltransferase